MFKITHHEEMYLDNVELIRNIKEMTELNQPFKPKFTNMSILYVVGLLFLFSKT